MMPIGRKIVALMPQVGGPMLVIAVAVAIETARQIGMQIPNPPAILVLLVVYAAFRGGYVPGLVSAALALIYIAWFFSVPGRAFEYSQENLVRVLVWAVCVPLMVWMIGRLKRQLVRHAERHLQAIEAAPNGMLMADRQGRIVLLNTQIEKLFGYARAELIGQPVERLVPERMRAAHRGQRDGFFADPRARAMGAGRDLFGLRKDGSAVPIEIGLNPVGKGEDAFVLASVIDITERKRAKEALKRLQHRHEGILNSMGEGLHGIDREGNIIFENPAAAAMLGWEVRELIGRPAHSTMHHTRADGSRYPQHECPIYATLRDGVTRRADDEVFWRKDGTGFPVSYTCAPLREGTGEILGAVVAFRDISESRRAEAQLHASNAELRIATDRAHQADRLKSAFLATMSHELRTPLNSIIGFTGILLQGLAGPLNPEQAKQLAMVQASARHLLALINDVLDISKIEAGQLRVDREPFDLRASVAKVVGIVRPLAEKKGLALRVEAAPAPALGELVGDARRVEQVLLNLLNNAIKFTARGEVTLSVALGGDSVRIRVADTGIGIKPEDLATLFQPFRQVDDGLARNHEGTGLGLAICRRLAELMGGGIQAESEWGKGSTFSFTLPIEGPATP